MPSSAFQQTYIIHQRDSSHITAVYFEHFQHILIASQLTAHYLYLCSNLTLSDLAKQKQTLTGWDLFVSASDNTFGDQSQEHARQEGRSQCSDCSEY